MRIKLYLFSVLMFACSFCIAGNMQSNGDAHCRIDLNHDGKLDIALFITTRNGGGELIALLSKKSAYDAYFIDSYGGHLNLACRHGKHLQETTAARTKGRSFTTNGTYIEVYQPESSSAAYYWDGKKFKGVMTSD